MQSHIAFLGAGNMASAMINGLLTTGFSPLQLRAADPSEEALEGLRALGIQQLSTSSEHLCDGADLIVAAVKPQIMSEALSPLKNRLSEGTALLSIAAGIPVRSLQRYIGDSTPVIRCMPNTPAMVGKGASALYASTHVTTTQRALAEAVTDSVGMTVWVAEEALLDAVTAVSGSGPAYFFSLIEAVSQTGVELGLEPETALALTLQTAIGAAELAQHSDMPVAKLRENVTSPGGTTEQALLALKDGHFDAVVSEAVRRCAERAKTLGEEFG
ncbi:MAG: pyrroline-5-carboxylate reductase [Luminiphilus sp.]|nr:pyrroline-5-carboxylate reductase [Luminiphilus sp.]